MGAQSVTFFKIVSELLTLVTDVSLNDDITARAVITSPFSYAMLLGAVFTCGFWILRLNAALRLFDAMFIVPLFQVFWVTLSVVGGGIFFKEFADCFRGETAVLFCVGAPHYFRGCLHVVAPAPTRMCAGKACTTRNTLRAPARAATRRGRAHLFAKIRSPRLQTGH